MQVKFFPRVHYTLVECGCKNLNPEVIHESLYKNYEERVTANKITRALKKLYLPKRGQKRVLKRIRKKSNSVF